MSGTTGARGRDGALQISTNGGSTFTTVPGVRATNPQINNNPADISNAASPGAAREMLADAGIVEFEVSIDGVVSSGTAFAALHAHAINRTVGRFRVNFGQGGRYEFQGVIGSWQQNHPHNDAQTFSASLMATGVVTQTAPT